MSAERREQGGGRALFRREPGRTRGAFLLAGDDLVELGEARAGRRGRGVADSHQPLDCGGQRRRELELAA